MLSDLQELVDSVFGTIDPDLEAWQLALRSVVTFVVTVAVIRLGNKRLFGKGTTFDTVVAIMIGSVMSRAITGSGSGSMVATLIAGSVLILLHSGLSWLAYRIDSFGPLVKGHEVLLVRDGDIVEDGMRETGTTKRDLSRAIREEGMEPDVSQIKLAYMERDGGISVIPKSSEPKILDVSVENGVQTVRVQME